MTVALGPRAVVGDTILVGHERDRFSDRATCHKEIRTRSVMDAVLGAPRTGCGKASDATRDDRGSNGLTRDQAFLVS